MFVIWVSSMTVSPQQEVALPWASTAQLSSSGPQQLALEPIRVSGMVSGRSRTGRTRLA